MYSLSSYTVAACGQLQVACTQEAPPEEMLYDDEYLTPLLANVDAIMTSTANATLQPQFAFSASTDPGVIPTASSLLGLSCGLSAISMHCVVTNL